MILRQLLIVGLATTLGFGVGYISRVRRPAVSGDVGSSNAVAGAPANNPTLNPLALAIDALNSQAELASLARLGHALDDLDSEQLQSLLNRVERSADRNVRNGLSWLYRYLLKRDPASAAQWIRPRLVAASQDGPPGFAFDSSSRGQVILAWAKADPKAALAFAKEHARSGLAGRLLTEIVQNWPDKDPALRLALIREFPPGMARNEALREHLGSWARKEPKAALAIAETIEDETERDRALKSVVTSWGDRDPAAAFEKYHSLGLLDAPLLWQLMKKGAAIDHRKAVESLALLTRGEFVRNAPVVAEAWAKQEPAAALSWALENGVELTGYHTMWQSIHHSGFNRSGSHSGPSSNPLSEAIKAKPDDTMAWIRSLPPGADRERLLILSTAFLKTPEQTITVYNELPPEAAARAAGSVVASFQKDLPAARAWVESLPPGLARLGAWRGLGQNSMDPTGLPAGPERDAVLSGRAFGRGGMTSPIPRLETISQVSDPLLKRDLFDQAVEEVRQFTGSDWLKQSREWLEKSDLPEEWKQSWRSIKNMD